MFKQKTCPYMIEPGFGQPGVMSFTSWGLADRLSHLGEYSWGGEGPAKDVVPIE